MILKRKLMRTSLTCPSVEVSLLAVTEKEPLRPGGKSDSWGGGGGGGGGSRKTAEKEM